MNNYCALEAKSINYHNHGAINIKACTKEVGVKIIPIYLDIWC